MLSMLGGNNIKFLLRSITLCAEKPNRLLNREIHFSKVQKNCEEKNGYLKALDVASHSLRQSCRATNSKEMPSCLRPTRRWQEEDSSRSLAIKRTKLEKRLNCMRRLPIHTSLTKSVRKHYKFSLVSLSKSVASQMRIVERYSLIKWMKRVSVILLINYAIFARTALICVKQGLRQALHM